MKRVSSVVVTSGIQRPQMPQVPAVQKTTTVSTTTVSKPQPIGIAKPQPAPVSFAPKPPMSAIQQRLEPKITTHQLEPQVQERRLWNLNNVLAAFIIGVVLVAIEFIAVPYIFEGDFKYSIMLALALLVIYAVILFFLLEPKVLREVKYSTIKTVETPVLREVSVEKPVYKTIEKPVIRTVERIVERPVIRTIEKPVYKTIEKPVIRTVTKVSKPIVRTVTKQVVKFKERPKLNIPRYDFTGSTETKTYHTRYCRLGKLIKKKYALHANTQDFFKKRKFAPCKVCILKEKKI